MHSSSSPFLFLHLPLLLLLLLLCPPAATADPYTAYCSTTGNFTANSTYQSNLYLLLSSLPSNASSSGGFSNSTAGAAPDLVSALALCRGDQDAAACFDCLSNASSYARQQCPYSMFATLYYDLCLLRYSNEPFLSSTTDDSPQAGGANPKNASDPALFDELVARLMNATADWAAYNSTRRFARGEAVYGADEIPTVYGLAQCTPDLTAGQCWECLQTLISEIKPLYSGHLGARILRVRCNLRYESNPFYDGVAAVQLGPSTPSTPAPSPTAPPSTTAGKKKGSTGTVLAITIPSVALVFIITIICFCLWRKRKPAREVKPPYETNPEDIKGVQSLLMDLSILQAATDNFSELNRLGEGGFGTVYKGVLPDGQEIAVKRLSRSSGQGLGELKNELVSVAKLQHKNLVRLLGVCLDQQEKLLVYEYVPNRSLDTILFDPEKRNQLDWGIRCSIIYGIARGLQYLHEDSRLQVIHRDLKASNILLDADMNPKISDFGLARLFGGDRTQGVTNQVAGTLGYMPPEYAMHGVYSIKTDVFSFGVLALEIMTGKSSGTFESEQNVYLLSYAWEHWRMGTLSEIIDSSLDNQHPESKILRCIHVALLCVQENPADRPKMSTVVLMLSSGTVSLQPPSRPAFYFSKTGPSKSVAMSRNEVSLTDLEPRP